MYQMNGSNGPAVGSAAVPTEEAVPRHSATDPVTIGQTVEDAVAAVEGELLAQAVTLEVTAAGVIDGGATASDPAEPDPVRADPVRAGVAPVAEEVAIREVVIEVDLVEDDSAEITDEQPASADPIRAILADAIEHALEEVLEDALEDAIEDAIEEAIEEAMDDAVEEIVAAVAKVPVAAPPLRPGEASAPALTIWPAGAIDEFRARLQEIQGRFVDAPTQAVTDAETLVNEAAAALAQALMAQTQALTGWRQDEAPDTERLRVALLAYRDYLDRALAL